MKPLPVLPLSRMLILVIAPLLLAVLWLPIWRIDLVAPQYPEGLALQIHANDIRGDVEIINGLNHYIGMKTLHKEDFPEFTILPIIIVVFALAFLVSGLLKRRSWIYITSFAFFAFGILAMVDFWRWEYDYGHNLDPNAAIVVPGMAYQPPLIGFKQLLNFGAYSFPDLGGWLFISAGVIALFVVIWEWRFVRKQKVTMSPINLMSLLLLATLFAGCTAKPEPIIMGKDRCASCKMTIADNRFSAEWLTDKGRVYKFDDLRCLQAFLTVPASEVQPGVAYLSAYDDPATLLPANQAWLWESGQLRTPMNGHVAAFKDSVAATAMHATMPGRLARWTNP